MLFSSAFAQITCLTRAEEKTKAFEQFYAQEIDISHEPWMVNISVGAEPFCGGVLIDLDFVMTAAHCLDRVQSKRFISVRLATKNGGYYGEARKVKEIRPHEDYYQATKAYDVAILQLDRPYNHIGRARIPRMLTKEQAHLYAQPGDCARVMGWGQTNGSENASETLLRVDVRIWSPSECEAAEGRLIGPYSLCAGYSRGQFDSCNGDSGGPLFVDGGVDRLLVGIVSWGKDCGREGRPGVYTRVSEIQEWAFREIIKMRAEGPAN